MARAAVWVVLLGLMTSPAQASPLQLFGFGGRSPGLAATGVADAVGFDSVYLNPAGLAEVRRKRLSLGTLVGTFELTGIDRAIDTAVGAELGGALPLPLGGALAGRVGLGLGFYVPTAVLVSARAPRPGTPYFALLESRTRVVGIQLGVGVKLDRRWSVGLGVLALAALTGSIHVSADAGKRFTSTSEQQLLAKYAPILGARYHHDDRLGFGLTLRFPSRSDFDIAVTSDLGSALPVSLPELRFAGVAQYDPLTVAVESSWRATPRLRVNAQLAWEHWSAFPRPTENPVAGRPPPPAPGFHDTIVPRLAVEWHQVAGPALLELRGGYALVWSPAPPMSGMSAFYDNDRHLLSTGLGLSATGSFPLRLDAWFQLHVLSPRHHDRPEGQDDVDTGGAIYGGGVVMGVDL
jgi:long-chain fatty acid transport protein